MPPRTRSIGRRNRCATFALPRSSSSIWCSTTARWRPIGPRSTSHSSTRAAVRSIAPPRDATRDLHRNPLFFGFRCSKFYPGTDYGTSNVPDSGRDSVRRCREERTDLMAIDYARLKAWSFPDVKQSYTGKDAILYALGIGLGRDPVNADELRFLYEDGLAVLPTFAVALGYPGGWLRDPKTGVDWKQVLHGEQELHLHRPLPPEGEVVGRTRIEEIIDKGAGKGALIYSSREVSDVASGSARCDRPPSAAATAASAGPRAPSRARTRFRSSRTSWNAIFRLRRARR